MLLYYVYFNFLSSLSLLQRTALYRQTNPASALPDNKVQVIEQNLLATTALYLRLKFSGEMMVIAITTTLVYNRHYFVSI